ncbi:nuclease family protein,UvrD/REP helicase [Leptolyngbya sp. PCC 7375]|nr:nuclease family protein,UvrD/REP helicase [Leptolyngbya sp. PCC 7375]
MALIIPDTIPSKASQGEKLLFKILSAQLPDDFIVWHEPRVNGLYPDFIIIGPEFGLLVLEVKGWYAAQVVRGNNNFFDIRWQRGDVVRLETCQHPLKQGHGYFGSVADKLKGYPILCNPDGNYQGRLCFPVGIGAVMSNMTEPQARNNSLYVLLKKPAVAYRDELQSWVNLPSSELIQRLKAMFTKADFAFAPLTSDQVGTIKGILHPEVAIKEIPAKQTSLSFEPEQPLPSTATILLSLDAEQERMAREIKSGHRLISGVAGSGKTLILTARAKALANRLTQHRILILCFNITLAAQLRSQLHSDTRNPQYKERIEVLHFHGWARTLLRSLPNPRQFANDEDYNQVLGEKVLAKMQSLPPEQRWDSVLVDEAHTFSQSWFTCCVAALQDPVDGDLLIVSDGSQSLYKRNKFTWKSVGINAIGGRSKRLTQNYRNTQEILTAAWGVLQTKGKADADATFPAVEPSAAIRSGPKPTIHLTRSKTAAGKAAIAKITTLLNSGYSPSDIAILYRWKSKKEEHAFNSLLSQLQRLTIPYYWVTQNQSTKRNYDVQRPGVRVITTLSSLGLEFKVVLLLWAEQFWDCQSHDGDKASLAQRQLYVAMTRAQDELHIFLARPVQFLSPHSFNSALIS